MKRVMTFREHAQACRDLAEQMPAAHRDQLEKMAIEWELMAEERERELRARVPPERRTI
ncbi:hypothetical protein [Phenylobacterium sp. SCN 70-31]|uniref:hypothetical protein n=1 Tax=Phenylobacterium sp. SCN 70-31 TaxID=1660129 RepID=UPI0025E2B335|nr:hypothetical protein [Phenylobacterium sp. SCN 70-31]